MFDGYVTETLTYTDFKRRWKSLQLISSSITVHHRSKDDSDRTRETLTDVEEIYAAVQFAVSRLLNVTALKSIFLKLFRAHVTAAARVDFIIDDRDETQQQPKKRITLNLF